MAEQRRLQEAMAEVQDSAMQDRKELEKWKQASEVVQAKLGKIYQLVEKAAGEGGADIDKVLYDAKFIMLGEES